VTTLTGEQQVKEGELLTVIFRQGLPGFGSSQKYNLYALEDNPFFYYLESVDEPEMSLVLMDPFSCFTGYSVELTEEDISELEVSRQEDVLVLTTVTFAGEQKMTTNLAAPIVINLKKKLARQVFITEKMDSMRTPLNYKKNF
jgi:flagellar assembly factor FliW